MPRALICISTLLLTTTFVCVDSFGRSRCVKSVVAIRVAQTMRWPVRIPSCTPNHVSTYSVAMAEDFEKARNLLLGAVNEVLSIASKPSNQGPGPSSLTRNSSGVLNIASKPSNSLTAGTTPTNQGPGPSTSARSSSGSSSSSNVQASLEEHRRLFGYKPSKGNAKGKCSQRTQGKRKGRTQWRKDCICLRNRQQSWKPSSEEKIELARMGLGLSAAEFSSDGDADHIHQIIMEKFPALEACGGYTLLRLAENSHNMVEIEGPDSGITVPFLKDILNQAKLYIRPLQKDITEEDIKLYSTPKV